MVSRKKRILKAFFLCVVVLVVIGILLALVFYAIMSQAAWRRMHTINPSTMPDSEWMSSDPEIYLANEGEGLGVRGYVLSNNTKYEFVFCPDNGSVVWFYDASCIDEKRIIEEKDILLMGDCQYSENKMVIKVEQDRLFDGAYKKIILYRVDVAGATPP